MNDQAMRFRLGVFVLASLILLAVLVTLFGGFPGIFQRYLTYTVTFDDATGVGPGTPVRRSGVRIGDARRVELDPDSGKVKVTIRVQQQYPLRRNDRAVLTRSVFGGDAAIDFVPRPPDPGGKVADRSPVEPGANFEGTTQTDLQTVLHQTSELMPPTQATLKEIRKSLARFEKSAPVVEQTLREFQALAKSANEVVPGTKKTNEAFQATAKTWSKAGAGLDKLLSGNEKRLSQTLDNLNEVLQRFARVFDDQNLKNLSATLQNAQKGTARMESAFVILEEVLKESNKGVKQLNETLARADAVVADLRQATRPLAQRSDSIARNLDESLARMNQTLGEVRELLRVVGQGDGTLQRFLADPSLYNNLNQAACLVTRTLPKVDRVIQDLEIFADKLARHPEAIGLGGVLNPGSGLKQAPSTWYQRPPGR
jgi:phospholipid/cholesterol/gamma-HCH transport system substrate-binding protein